MFAFTQIQHILHADEKQLLLLNKNQTKNEPINLELEKTISSAFTRFTAQDLIYKLNPSQSDKCGLGVGQLKLNFKR